MPWKIMNQLSFYDITIVHDTESQFMGSLEWEAMGMAIAIKSVVQSSRCQGGVGFPRRPPIVCIMLISAAVVYTCTQWLSAQCGVAIL